MVSFNIRVPAVFDLDLVPRAMAAERLVLSIADKL